MNYTVQYYDLVLVAIFATMAVGAAVGTLTSLALPTAVAVAVLVIAHGLFVNGPVDGPEDLADEVEALN